VTGREKKKIEGGKGVLHLKMKKRGEEGGACEIITHTTRKEGWLSILSGKRRGRERKALEDDDLLVFI